jgi:hypothetical protein
MSITLASTLTCPHCGTAKAEIMPTDACQYFYDCTGCGTLLKPQPGDCCVFCSYGSVPCPPIQQDQATACCSTADHAVPSAEAGPWPFCSLDRDAFRERMAEIDALAIRFEGRPHRTDRGMELVFPARDGLRPALDALVDKERQCCGTLAWSIEVRGEALALCIAASGHERIEIHRLAARLGQTHDRR